MHRPLLRVAAILLTAWGATANAADGAQVYEQCAACHGRNGASTESAIPIIGGYSSKYIVDSLKAFKKKIRACTETQYPSGPKKGTKTDMCRVANDLSDEDAEAVARHLAGQKFVRAKQPFDAAKAKRGEPVYKLRCQKCHEDNGASPDEDNGILAGQWMGYVRDQLVAFRTGKRPIDDKMKQRLDRVNKDDEDLLVHFFASQQ
ncbi:MAG TPA: c-type cytochrome [Usitatibacter sp.]|nr:c-type cytochrome [Usitatibacter sp.]